MKLTFVTLLALFVVAVAPLSLLAQATQAPPASQVPCCPPTTGTTSGGGGGFMADISPYGGYVWPLSLNGGIGDFKGSQIWGVRGGIFVTSGFEIGANYYYNAHFQPRRSNGPAALAGDLGFPQGAVRANVYELEFTYDFGRRNLFGSTNWKPYVVVAGGGLNTRIKKNADTFVLNTRNVFVPGATPAGLQKELVNNNLQNVLPGIDTTNGVAFVPFPTGTSVFVANDVMDGGDNFFTFSYGGGLKAARLWGPMGIFGDFRGRTVPNFFGKSNTWPELSAGLNFTWGEK